MDKYIPQNNNIIDKKLLFDYNPLVLSLLGDGVHTLIIRGYLTEKYPYSSTKLHSKTTEFVCAKAQAAAMQTLYDELNDEENFIYRKCKNVHAHNIPKNATKLEYSLATAFEGIIGYLYLNGQISRLAQLLKKIENQIKTESSL